MRAYLYLFVSQDKEAYRWAIKETIKSMLAFGWTIERTKERDSFGLHACTRRISQSGQVCVLLTVGHIHFASGVSSLLGLYHKSFGKRFMCYTCTHFTRLHCV